MPPCPADAALSVALALVTAWASIALSYVTDWPVGFFVGALGAAWYALGRIVVRRVGEVRAPVVQ